MLPYAFNQLRQAALNYQLNGGSPGHPTAGLDPRTGFPHGANPYAAALNPYAALDPLLGYRAFGPRFIHEEPKPQHSYIGLIAMAILSVPDKKMVLSDIYQWILDNYSYFRNRGPGWRNSIRHNLSLNDCFIKSGRSANGKGHYWAIHPANEEDFKKGDFRRRRAQRKVRKHMGLTVPDDEEDSDDSPCQSPIAGQTNLSNLTNPTSVQLCAPPLTFPPTHSVLAGMAGIPQMPKPTLPSPSVKLPETQISPGGSSGESSGGRSSSVDISPKICSVPLKKRMFDVESLLAPEAKRSKIVTDSPPSPKNSDNSSSPTGIAPLSAAQSMASQMFNPLTLSPTTAGKMGIMNAPFFPFGFPLSPTGMPGTNPFSAFAPFSVVPNGNPNFSGHVIPPKTEIRENPPSPNAAAQWQETFAKIMARSYHGRQQNHQNLGSVPKLEPESNLSVSQAE